MTIQEILLYNQNKRYKYKLFLILYFNLILSIIQVRDLEMENYELKDKVFNTENNVSLFIRDMSDLLD